jgi:hypothetical protein
MNGHRLGQRKSRLHDFFGIRDIDTINLFMAANYNEPSNDMVPNNAIMLVKNYNDKRNEQHGDDIHHSYVDFLVSVANWFRQIDAPSFRGELVEKLNEGLRKSVHDALHSDNHHKVRRGSEGKTETEKAIDNFMGNEKSKFIDCLLVIGSNL